MVAGGCCADWKNLLGGRREVVEMVSNQPWGLYILLHIVTYLFLFPIFVADVVKPIVPRWRSLRSGFAELIRRGLCHTWPWLYKLIFTTPVHVDAMMTSASSLGMLAEVARVDPSNAESAFASISFVGCSWLMVYHVGVVRALVEHGLVDNERTILLGSSSGSIIAAAVVCGVSLQDCMALVEEMANDGSLHRRVCGPVGRMSHYVRQGLQRCLPEDAHQRASGRLYISTTSYETRHGKSHLQNHLISEFSSREDLINLILASCYIPGYYESPVRCKTRGMFFLDGGLTNNQPVLKGTLTVSPYAGTAIISPSTQDPTWKFDPLDRLLPPHIDQLYAYERQGFRDTQRMLPYLNPTTNVSPP